MVSIQFQSKLYKVLLEFPSGRAMVNLTRNHEVGGLIPDLAQWVKDLVL